MTTRPSYERPRQLQLEENQCFGPLCGTTFLYEEPISLGFYRRGRAGATPPSPAEARRQPGEVGTTLGGAARAACGGRKGPARCHLQRCLQLQGADRAGGLPCQPGTRRSEPRSPSGRWRPLARCGCARPRCGSAPMRARLQAAAEQRRVAQQVTAAVAAVAAITIVAQHLVSPGAPCKTKTARLFGKLWSERIGHEHESPA